MAVIAITRGGLVPAAIVARELGVRIIDTVCIASYDHTKQGDLQVLKGISEATAKLGGGTGKGLSDRRRPRRHRQDRQDGARDDAGRAFRHRLRQAEGTAAGRYLHHRSVAGHLDLSFPGIPRCRSSRRSATARRDACRHSGAMRKHRSTMCKCTSETLGIPSVLAHHPANDEREVPMPLQNRVTPTGDIVATPHRGLFTGNRGIIHDPATKTLLKKRWSGPAWITCVCEFRGWRRKVMATRSWTELFFLDEATAFAAGHRPCFFCRRDDANRFRAAWEAGQWRGKRSRAGHRRGAASGTAGPRPKAAASAADAARTAARGHDAAGRRCKLSRRARQNAALVVRGLRRPPGSTEPPQRC